MLQERACWWRMTSGRTALALSCALSWALRLCYLGDSYVRMKVSCNEMCSFLSGKTHSMKA